MVEIVVALMVLAVLMAIAIPAYRTAGQTSRNAGAATGGQQLASAMARFNADFPPLGTSDPLMASSTFQLRGTTTAAANAISLPAWCSGGPADDEMVGRNYCGGVSSKPAWCVDPVALVDIRKCVLLVPTWPGNPFANAAPIIVHRNSSAVPPVGDVTVERGFADRSTFRVKSWGKDKAGAAIIVYQQTLGPMVLPAELTTDCGNANAPQCAGA